MRRPSREEWFMQMAALVSERGTCQRKQVGAVITLQNHIISVGYNGAPPGMPHCTDVGCLTYVEGGGCTRAIHAEVNALALSARYGVSTDGATMYCTCSTCVPCAQLLISAGIRCFVYFEEYRIKDGLQLLHDAGVRTKQWTPQRSSV